MAAFGGNEKESCHICKKPVENIKKHVWAEHGGTVACQLCDQEFPVGILRWHIIKEHCQDKVVECALCGKKFTTKDALQGHIRQIHLSETSTCNICGQECNDLHAHVSRSHNGKELELSLIHI